MLSSESVKLGLLGYVAEDVDKLLFASVIELTPKAPKIFLDLAALSINPRAIVQQSLPVLELLSGQFCSCVAWGAAREVIHVTDSGVGVGDEIARNMHVHIRTLHHGRAGSVGLLCSSWTCLL